MTGTGVTGTGAPHGVVVVGLDGRDEHDTGGWHPERADRLVAVEAAVTDLGDAATRVAARPATDAEITRVHDAPYLRALGELCVVGGGSLDPDTVVAEGSCRTARLAAGAGLAAVDALRDGTGEAAFVAVRPPGHHARSDRGMGFCLFNNVAVAAARLVDDGERVVIVDWDVHHGNGTQQIFWDDPRVLYVSMHESPLYPGTGAAAETGGAAAPGTTINFPFPRGTRGDAYLAALDEVVAPAVEAFAPTWVLVSAGYDAHRADPLAGLELSAGDFALLARRVRALVPTTGRTVLFLEGGYDLDALRAGVGATFDGLLGRPAGPAEPPTGGGPGPAVVAATAAEQQRAREEHGA